MRKAKRTAAPAHKSTLPKRETPPAWAAVMAMICVTAMQINALAHGHNGPILYSCAVIVAALGGVYIHKLFLKK